MVTGAFVGRSFGGEEASRVAEDFLGGEIGEDAIGSADNLVGGAGGGVGAVPRRIGWAEDREGWFTHGGGEVHGAAVVCDDQSGFFDELGQAFQGSFGAEVEESSAQFRWEGGRSGFAAAPDDSDGLVLLEPKTGEVFEERPLFFCAATVWEHEDRTGLAWRGGRFKEMGDVLRERGWFEPDGWERVGRCV